MVKVIILLVVKVILFDIECNIRYANIEKLKTYTKK